VTACEHGPGSTLPPDRVDHDLAWPSYRPEPFHDELVNRGGTPRPVAEALWRRIAALGPEALAERQVAADREMRAIGVTFTVYDDGQGVDRAWPFDVIPRVIPADEWHHIETGLVQRLYALNLFIDDVYHDQRSVKSGLVPPDLVAGSPTFRRECMGIDPPGGIWAHICGSDLVRDADGTFYVLEDNLRVPSGMSYLLENRMVAKHVFPELFRDYSIEPVDPFVGQMVNLLSSVSPSPREPTIVVLTPGVHNAAYFEHAFLAQQLGVELVEGSDLVVLDDDCVYVQTIEGLERVDVIYRRVDDLFLDPEVFHSDSLIGVAGMVRAWRAGRVALVNAPGAGVADDKALYAFVPDIIRYFLDEEPILDNVPTLRCADEASRHYVAANLSSLVMKPTSGSGGAGIVIGPQASADELDGTGRLIEENPRGWVAQPVLSLSTAPTLCDGEVVPRHVDLRPFTLIGPDGAYVTRGGLTRVATVEGSLVVNSSQGGGSKDTWIVDPDLSGKRPAAPGREAVSRRAAGPGQAARAGPADRASHRFGPAQ
jgi:uncharacterized circularly permuted ATP-grasp superfamily protein